MVQILLNYARCRIIYTPNILFRPLLVHFYSIYPDSTDNNISSAENKENNNKSGQSATDKSAIEIPEPPTTCCMSGCANCVWIEYAEKITELFKDGGEIARKKILEHVTDPNIQSFLMMELRTMKFKK